MFRNRISTQNWAFDELSGNIHFTYPKDSGPILLHLFRLFNVWLFKMNTANQTDIHDFDVTVVIEPAKLPLKVLPEYFSYRLCVSVIWNGYCYLVRLPEISCIKLALFLKRIDIHVLKAILSPEPICKVVEYFLASLEKLWTKPFKDSGHPIFYESGAKRSEGRKGASIRRYTDVLHPKLFSDCASV